MRKKSVLFIGVAAVLVIAGLFVYLGILGSKPFKSLQAKEIVSIELTLLPPNIANRIEDPGQIQQITNALNKIVIYEKNDAWGDYDGQYIHFALSMKSGETIEVGTNNSFFTIDGQGYKTKYAPAQELSSLGNSLAPQAGQNDQPLSVTDLEKFIGLSQKEIVDILGKPLGSLSGLWGDIYPLDSSTTFTVYYDKNGVVNSIRSGNTVIPAANSDVVIAIKDGTLTPSGVTLIFTNNSDLEYTYGESFIIQRKSNDQWQNVTTIIDNYGFNDIGYMLEGKQTGEMDVKWEWIYGKLESGEYRITKDIIFVRDAGDLDIYHLSAEFAINT